MEEFKEFDIKISFKGRIFRVSVRVRSVLLFLVVVIVFMNEKKNEFFRGLVSKKKEIIEIFIDIIVVKEIKMLKLFVFYIEEDVVEKDVIVLFVESFDKC